MGLFGFSSKSKNAIRCKRCNSPLKEEKIRYHNGDVYCDFCLDRVRSEETSKQRTAKPLIIESESRSSGMHVAILEIEQAFREADLKCKTVHIGDQCELIAGISGKGCTYEIKFICKDNTDNNDVAVRIFNLIQVPQNKTDQMLMTLNSIQRKYRFMRFTVDSDNEVNVEYDMPNCTTDVGPIAVELLVRTMQIIDDIYPELMRCLWG